MSAFIQTAHAVAPIALVAAAICAGAYLGIKAVDKWAARNVDRMVDDGLAAICAADVAADTLARQQRLDRANDIGREVRGAFLDQMQDRPHLAAIRARQEAVVLDDTEAVAEWLEAGS